MMKDLYRTIEAPAEGNFRDKGSKFLAFAYTVNSEEEIREQIGRLKKEYHDARHHCFAWRLGADMEQFRVNDDGEPSGSAGKPIFGQIQSRNLTNILVVVVRYFGGTLLGVGGLMRAYRSASSAALDQARIIELKVHKTLKLEFGYEQMNSVMKVIKDLGLEFEDQDFDLKCTLSLKVWTRMMDRVLSQLSIIEGCKASLKE
ncbi:MAG: YigZ family protein [Bacteroidota bacterium]